MDVKSGILLIVSTFGSLPPGVTPVLLPVEAAGPLVVVVVADPVVDAFIGLIGPDVGVFDTDEASPLLAD